MRVLTLTHELPPLGGGGGRVAFELAGELAARGHEIDFVTMRPAGLPASEEPIPGVRVLRVPCLRRSIELCDTHEMLTFVVSGLLGACRLARTRSYDLCHAHFVLPAGIVARALRTIAALPYVLSAHGSDVPDYNPDRFRREHRVSRPLLRAILRGAGGVVAPSRHLESLIGRHHPAGGIEVVPHGVDAHRLRPSTTDRVSILTVTRMLERKGVQYLLAALEGFEPAGLEVNLVGAGPYLDELRRIARQRRVTVRFHGWVDGDSEEMRRLYERASIFVMTSESESFGMVLLDAMCAGLAIVTADGGGCREVTGDTALLVPPRDPAAIRAALRRLVDDPGLRQRLGAKARRRVETYYDWHAIGGRYEELYRRVLASRRAPLPAGGTNKGRVA